MADTKGYEVIGVDELTVHKTVSALPQPDGSVIYQNGLGQTYLLGEVIPAEDVAEDWKQALDAEEGSLYEALKNKLKPSGDEPSENLAQRLGLPFEGYDDMEANDIVLAMSVLPSGTIQRIKEYEANRDEPRAEIVDYNIGYGEEPNLRQTTVLEVPEMAEGKASARLTTRSVPPDGPTVAGEGITGTGDPQKPYGVTKDAAAGDEEAVRAQSTSKARGNVAAARRGRRERSPKPATGGRTGGTSLEAENE